ncbi:hypothetical protein GYB22_04655 [bacterium]|nr:hypothetical protein [bacterium]
MKRIINTFILILSCFVLLAQNESIGIIQYDSVLNHLPEYQKCSDRIESQKARINIICDSLNAVYETYFISYIKRCGTRDSQMIQAHIYSLKRVEEKTNNALDSLAKSHSNLIDSIEQHLNQRLNEYVRRFNTQESLKCVVIKNSDDQDDYLVDYSGQFILFLQEENEN